MSEAEAIVYRFQTRGYVVQAVVEQQAVARLATAGIESETGLAQAATTERAER
jgi:hypothetical protein